MKEDECKDCGSGLVFEGSLMSGKMVCRHCAQVEKAPVNQRNPGKSNLYNVGNRIGDTTGTPGDQAYVSDSAYKGFSSFPHVRVLVHDGHVHTIHVDPEWTCDPYRDQNARRK
jgi:hypothetical protein